MHTEDDVMALIESFENLYDTAYTDIYPVDVALQDFKDDGYEFVLETAIALADELNEDLYFGLD